ncbi:MAG TPA: MopE-related protein [Polyangiaceae bacterium]|nr:MopE-related protein [Polyangiaceae bacterium]
MRALLWSLRAALPLALSVVTLAAASGCTTEAVCFSACTGVEAEQGGGGSKGGTAGSSGIELGGSTMTGTGGSIMIGMGGDQTGIGGGQLEDAGTACDNVDLQTDINNCGTCGNVCIFTGAEAMCVKGKCEIGECRDARYDLDGDPNNGCEYACSPAADDVEVCNYLDDDCDGVVDNGFDLTSDAENCGVCGTACSLLHADSQCQEKSGTPSCVVNGCEDGWYDIDGVDANGCEYQCEKTGPGGVACTPGDASCGQEVCDAYDNDCNGIINDGNEASGGPGGGQPCFEYCGNMACKGECTAGISSCVGSDLVCIPGKGPSLEVCDTKDNDCDGVVDNGFDLSTDSNNCGSCGTSCVDAVPNAIGKCADPDGAGPTAPGCAILACKAGYKDLVPGTPGCEACPKFPTTAETCNGIDDDCDGVVDNIVNPASQRPDPAIFCNNGRVLAGTACQGITVKCGGISGWVCDYTTAASPSDIEIDPVTKKVRVIEAACDGKDGNCDKQIDEAFLNKGQDCSIGTGVCARTSKYACKADKTGTECPVSAVATDANDELCNGIDDDCDGQVDERVPVAGSTCYNGGSHACLGYVDPMVKVSNNLWVYSYEASRPDATATDPGVYDVRSCSKAGVLPWTSISQVDAAATCAAIPTSVTGTKMRLCTEAEWQTSCLDGGSATTASWSFSMMPKPYDDDVCNDASAGIDAPWVTAFNNGQSQRCRTSSQIWDMSGNVAEWTSSCVTVLGKQYCRVRGGSYLSQGPATACNFSFVLDVPSFLNFDLGFRCCSSVAP